MDIKKTRSFKNIFTFYFIFYLSLGIVPFIFDKMRGPYCFSSLGGSICHNFLFTPIYYVVGFFILMMILISIGSINNFLNKGKKITDKTSGLSPEEINEIKGKRTGALVLPIIIISGIIFLLSKTFFYISLILIFLLSLMCLLKIKLNIKNSGYIIISLFGIFYIFFYLLAKFV